MEARRRTQVVDSFPDGRAAPMLVAARLRHVSGSKWGTRRYLDLDLLRHHLQEAGGELKNSLNPAPESKCENGGHHRSRFSRSSSLSRSRSAVLSPARLPVSGST